MPPIVFTPKAEPLSALNPLILRQHMEQQRCVSNSDRSKEQLLEKPQHQNFSFTNHNDRDEDHKILNDNIIVGSSFLPSFLSLYALLNNSMFCYKTLLQLDEKEYLSYYSIKLIRLMLSILPRVKTTIMKQLFWYKVFCAFFLATVDDIGKKVDTLNFTR